MKEEKRRSMLTLLLSPGNNGKETPNKNKQNDPHISYSKFKQNDYQIQNKQKFVRAVKRIGTKQTIKSFHVQVNDSQAQKIIGQMKDNKTSGLNAVKGLKNDKQIQNTNKQIRRKLKRVGKKVWVSAYKQNIQQEQEQEQGESKSPNLLDPRAEEPTDDFSDFKQHSRNFSNLSQTNKISVQIDKQVIQEINYQLRVPDQNINYQRNSNSNQMIKELKQKQILFQKTDLEQASKLASNNVEKKSSCQEVEICESSSLIIQGDLDVQISSKNETKIQQTHSDVDIEKMLEEIQNGHSNIKKKSQQPKISLQIKQLQDKRFIPLLQTKFMNRKQSTSLLKDQKQNFQKIKHQEKKSGEQILKKTFQRKQSRRYILQTQKSAKSKNNIDSLMNKRESVSQDAGMKQLGLYYMKNSKKPLPPAYPFHHQKQRLLVSQGSKILQDSNKIQKLSSINTVHSSMTDSKVELKAIKLKQSLKKQLQNKQFAHQSMHSSQKKQPGTRKIGIQKLKYGDGTDESKITSSLKKNFKQFEVNRYILQARKQLV